MKKDIELIVFLLYQKDWGTIRGEKLRKGGNRTCLKKES